MPVLHKVIRLKPGEDIKKSLDSLVLKENIQAGWVVTAVGSLAQYHLRFANQESGTQEYGHFEIVSLVGALSVQGSHLHISISDSTGRTVGGHLLEGNLIYTTAEIVIGISDELIFKREQDGTTPWKELQVEQKKKD